MGGWRIEIHKSPFWNKNNNKTKFVSFQHKAHHRPWPKELINTKLLGNQINLVRIYILV